MKRINTKEIKNAGISDIELDPEKHEELIDRTFQALRKFSSNKKTKSVHKILEEKLLFPALFHGSASEYLMSPNFKNNTLRRMSFNLFFFDDSLDRYGAVAYATKLSKLKEKMQKEKTYLSDKQVYNLEQLNIEKDEVSDKLLDSLNYIKLVDGTYFGWLLLLADSALSNESLTKPKIVTLTADILAQTLKKMYMKVNSTIDNDVHQLIDAIAVYFIRIYYYGETAQYVLNLMSRAFDEETLETIKKARVTQFKDFNELSLLMKETQLLPLTTNTFDLQMNNMFGKYGYEYYIKESLVTFIAFMANLANPSQLFKDAYEVDDEAHERLEELLLNEQKKIKLEKRDV